MIKAYISYVISAVYRDDRGATSIEYGLIAALIAVSIIAGASSTGMRLTSVFDAVSTNLADATAIPDETVNPDSFDASPQTGGIKPPH